MTLAFNTTYTVMNPWKFWILIFFIGVALFLLFRRFNQWWVYRDEGCHRGPRKYCLELKACYSWWWPWVFNYMFIIALLTGYRWWQGIVFLILFQFTTACIAFCTTYCFTESFWKPWWEFLLGILGFLFGLILRHIICWFPLSSCFGPVPAILL